MIESVQPRQGEVRVYHATFAPEDVATFCRLSGDEGRHHLEPAPDGRVMVHGLLTVSVATRLGADLHYLAHRMEWIFVRPVWSGERIEARVRLSRVEARDDGTMEVDLDVRIFNGAGKLAVRGESSGLIASDEVRRWVEARARR
jgi:acyl dehydratase